MVQVEALDEFTGWFSGLADAERARVRRSINLLQAKGYTLGFPHSSAIKNTRYAIRELRVQAAGVPLRVFYAFDPKRRAILILGGNKTGDALFYDRMVQRVEGLWEQYLKNIP